MYVCFQDLIPQDQEQSPLTKYTHLQTSLVLRETHLEPITNERFNCIPEQSLASEHAICGHIPYNSRRITGDCGILYIPPTGQYPDSPLKKSLVTRRYSAPAFPVILIVQRVGSVSMALNLCAAALRPAKSQPFMELKTAFTSDFGILSP
ncbi:hypothetical protein T265_10334 [Opisthorchis viverrini]|uniref:Uncharacterized protein n=1 Tax=Opisthorchis viverrini TaxID=6198 RepID=A0A075A1Q3_OPIVI|nr:hypothetical protein T265_10334 [Opisthorchis viverrini]KER21334.1 hypothetical protein T265_10334 [Opisthorchis viverrini]